MNKQFAYIVAFWTVLILAFLIRFLPSLNNNFYFTIDQGNDAIFVREITSRHQLPLRGPETGVKGVFAGPLWYYFIGIGYVVFAGNPYGAVFLLIILNVFLTATVTTIIARKISKLSAIIVAVSLQFFWWFYDASRFAFNPFPLVPLSIILILLLSSVLEGKKHYFIYAAIPVGLAFNSEVAGAAAFLLFYLTLGSFFLVLKLIKPRHFIFSIAILAIFFTPHLISEISSQFSQTKALMRQFQEPQGLTSQYRFPFISSQFSKILSQTAFPQNQTVGLILFATITILYNIIPKFPKTIRTQNSFISHFVFLTLILIALSWLFFSLTTGWQVWHTVYVAPLLFISLLLMICNLPKILGIPFLLVVLISQFLFFKNLYFKFARPFEDPSIMANELQAIDWVYQKSAGVGFYVYSYLPSVYDYPYQYLFWWYGKKTYGYLPCEYSTFPKTPNLLIPGEKYYQEPKRNCQDLRFLIIEPDSNTLAQNRWLEQVTRNTILIEETNKGEIKLEKRKIKTN